MLNRGYNLKLDLKFRCNNSNMEFNQFDKNTSDFFIQINNCGNSIDLSEAIVTLVVLKPNGTTDAQFLEIKENNVYADLKPSMKDLVGQYQCKAMAVIGTETVITDIFTYTVNEDKVLSAFNSEVETSEKFTLLIDMLNRLSSIELDENSRVEAEIYAKAVAKACLEYLGIAYKEENKPSTPPTNNNSQMLAVCIGAYKDRANADKALKEAKEKGFKDVYLIPR